MIDLLLVNHKKFNVIQLISHQDKFGKEQAAILASKGVDVKVIDDAGVGKFLPEIDVVLLGCEIIMHETFIVKTGAHIIAAAANFYKIPVYVLADSRKLLNKKYLIEVLKSEYFSHSEVHPAQLRPLYFG